MQETICAENNRINLIDGSGKVDILMGHIKAHSAMAVAFRFVLSVLDMLDIFVLDAAVWHGCRAAELDVPACPLPAGRRELWQRPGLRSEKHASVVVGGFRQSYRVSLVSLWRCCPYMPTHPCEVIGSENFQHSDTHPPTTDA